jgi:hypothetical protein
MKEDFVELWRVKKRDKFCVSREFPIARAGEEMRTVLSNCLRPQPSCSFLPTTCTALRNQPIIHMCLLLYDNKVSSHCPLDYDLARPSCNIILTD